MLEYSSISKKPDFMNELGRARVRSWSLAKDVSLEITNGGNNGKRCIILTDNVLLIYETSGHKEGSVRNIRCANSDEDRNAENEINHKPHEYLGVNLPVVETEVLVPGSRGRNEGIFLARLDDELNQGNAFYLVKETEFQKHAEILDMQMQTLFELKLEDERQGFNHVTSLSEPAMPWLSDHESDRT
ncbi:hypothetical protein R1sor_008305 [Riccia sorocarpa]|uniref:SPX domain-containing protein n=1 Tax=Riccia sorocarpa TaxID=122646 RepID=A0ABD3HZ86_9MARC